MGYYENQEADYYMGHPPEAEGEESTGEPETQKIIKEWKCLLGLCPAFDCPNVGGTFSGICSVYADSPLYNCEDDERTQIQIEFIEKLLQAQAKQIRLEERERMAKIFHDYDLATAHLLPEDESEKYDHYAKFLDQILNQNNNG